MTKTELEQLETLFNKAVDDGLVDVSSDDYVGYVVDWANVKYDRYFMIKIIKYN